VAAKFKLSFRSRVFLVLAFKQNFITSLKGLPPETRLSTVNSPGLVFPSEADPLSHWTINNVEQVLMLVARETACI
jgi:hypothetical protein